MYIPSIIDYIATPQVSDISDGLTLLSEGVLPIVPELRLNMAISEIPEQFSPMYQFYEYDVWGTPAYRRGFPHPLQILCCTFSEK